MRTLFNRSFKYLELGTGSYSDTGDYIPGGLSVRTVRGTVQTMTAQECEPYIDGSRNSGFVKIYASERLEARKEGGNAGGFVFYDGNCFQLLDSMPNLNRVISHHKYVAALIERDNVPAEIKEAFDGFQD